MSSGDITPGKMASQPQIFLQVSPCTRVLCGLGRMRLTCSGTFHHTSAVPSFFWSDAAILGAFPFFQQGCNEDPCTHSPGHMHNGFFTSGITESSDMHTLNFTSLCTIALQTVTANYTQCKEPMGVCPRLHQHLLLSELTVSLILMPVRWHFYDFSCIP